MPGPPPSPIFHVGMHKTATSWFQKSFYPFVEGYRFINRRVVRRAMLTKSPLAFDAGAVRDELGLDQGAPVIICEEDLSGVLHNGGLLTNYVAKEIATQLHAIAPDARIVLFVREQTAIAASLYQQYVREGGTASVRHYLFPQDYRHLEKIRPLKVPRFDFSPFEYDRLVAHYDSLFGRDRVFVFAHEQLARDPEGFLRQFCDKLQLPLPPDVDRSRVNSSYRSGLLPVARFLNLFTRRAVADKTTIVHIPFWYPARKELLKALNSVPLFGKPPRPERLLGRRTIDWIRQRFWESNARLEERMGIDLAALGYATAAPAQPVERPRRPKLLRSLMH